MIVHNSRKYYILSYIHKTYLGKNKNSDMIQEAASAFVSTMLFLVGTKAMPYPNFGY